jgi:RHS repeat-associated protein
VVYLGNYYEWDAGTNTPTKYYYAGSARIAMRTGTGSGTTGLTWLLTDHPSLHSGQALGSTSITADGASGAKQSELRYKSWGELRYASQPTTTGLRFTGQRMEGIGLYFYGARWYDPSLGRWAQPDTIVPLNQGVQAWDRYAYANNNPVRYNDPTGHCIGPLVVVCVALIEASPIIIEAATYAITAYVIADLMASNPPTINGTQVNIGIIVPPGPVPIPEIIDAVDVANTTPSNLYAFGNKAGPRPPRPGKDIFPDNSGNVGPEVPPFPNGASTFADPNMAPLNGPYHELPAGTQLPDGLSVVADGVDVNPLSQNPPTHHTIYPSKSMPSDDFSNAFRNLPWKYAGKK